VKALATLRFPAVPTGGAKAGLNAELPPYIVHASPDGRGLSWTFFVQEHAQLLDVQHLMSRALDAGLSGTECAAIPRVT